jgi:hypothetical protein
MKTVCKKCGEEINGYIGLVNTVETWKQRLRPEEWCESCCEDNGMCKCEGCSEEFAEEFRMPHIRGGLFCVPCAQAKVPKHFDKTPIFY